MARVFVSYSRKDVPFVRKLSDAVAAQKREAWVDWKDIPSTAEWLREFFPNIEAADNFIFVISPESVASANCRKKSITPRPRTSGWFRSSIDLSQTRQVPKLLANFKE
jgi:hypothetical protein